eukprot:9303307-Lingulodinium_polyedra.AAC.1
MARLGGGRHRRAWRVTCTQGSGQNRCYGRGCSTHDDLVEHCEGEQCVPGGDLVVLEPHIRPGASGGVARGGELGLRPRNSRVE